jgi:hypothetical protein
MGMFMRSLVLCNALLLVLPQGWCCLLFAQTACQGKAPAKAADCCHCSGGAKHEPSAPTPQPAKPFKACCAQSDALARSSGEIVHPDLGLALPLIAKVSGHPSFGKPVQASFDFHSHSPPLQLLHCVWLC